MPEGCEAVQVRRIFVGNLPNTINEQSLHEEFANFGNVDKVEVKTKGLEDGQTKFAFVTLALASEEDLNKCLNRFSRYKFHGEFLKVQVARESFMERLKREWVERDAAQNKKNDKTETIVENQIRNHVSTKLPEIASKTERESSSSSNSSESSSDSDTKSQNKTKKAKQIEVNVDKLPCKTVNKLDFVQEKKQSKNDNHISKKESKIANENESRSSSSSASSSDDSSDSDSQSAHIRNKINKAATDKIQTIKEEEEQPMFIAKKNAHSSVHNGKIKIQRTSTDPIHIISKKNTVHKTLEGSAKESDKKRKESLHKMKDQYNKQKLAIKNALTNIDSANKTSKIVFDDNDGDVAVDDKNFEGHIKNESKRKMLFNDNNVDSGEESEDYSKAFEIKEQFQGEKGMELLKLQSRFKLDPRFAMDEKFLETKDEVEEKETVSKNKIVQDDERKWQLDIIGQVIGKKINTERPAQKKPVKNLITRFDPTKEEHQKFYKSLKEEGIEATANDVKPLHGIEQQPEVEVSKERYYEVSEDLKDAIMTSGQGFSLLSMLGRAKDSPERAESFQQYVEIPLEKSKNASIALDNPFKYDSSDSEDDGNKSNSKAQTKQKIQKTNSVTKTIDPADMLFLLPTDKRLEEGLKFFATPEIDPDRDYDEVKRNLRKIINRKIAKKRKHTEGFKTVASKFKRSKKAK